MNDIKILNFPTNSLIVSNMHFLIQLCSSLTLVYDSLTSFPFSIFLDFVSDLIFLMKLDVFFPG